MGKGITTEKLPGHNVSRGKLMRGRTFLSHGGEGVGNTPGSWLGGFIGWLLRGRQEEGKSSCSKYVIKNQSNKKGS